METLRALAANEETDQAESSGQAYWTKTYPTDDKIIILIVNVQFAGCRRSQWCGPPRSRP
jgi:hypothetical protein